jgi:hypothetical protein
MVTSSCVATVIFSVLLAAAFIFAVYSELTELGCLGACSLSDTKPRHAKCSDFVCDMAYHAVRWRRSFIVAVVTAFTYSLFLLISKKFDIVSVIILFIMIFVWGYFIDLWYNYHRMAPACEIYREGDEKVCGLSM